jgi:hypothetical protein
VQPKKDRGFREVTAGAAKEQRWSYESPRLTVFGSLEELTRAIRGGPKPDGGHVPFHKWGPHSH